MFVKSVICFYDKFKQKISILLTTSTKQEKHTSHRKGKHSACLSTKNMAIGKLTYLPTKAIGMLAPWCGEVAAPPMIR